MAVDENSKYEKSEFVEKQVLLQSRYKLLLLLISSTYFVNYYIGYIF